MSGSAMLSTNRVNMEALVRYMLSVKSLIGVVVGGLGGAASAALVGETTARGTVKGAIFGLMFVMLAANRAISLGSGLLWGLGYSFLLWITLPAGIVPFAMGQASAMGMLDTARELPLRVMLRD